MRYRILGRTGISVSEIGVGAWQLGGPLLLDGRHDGHPDLGRKFVVNLIRRCGDELGVNLIDTAEQYAAGESERRVGEALAGQRDRWVVSTKFGATVGDVQRIDGAPSGKRVSDVSAKRMPVALEGSLKRLRTDYIDTYLYHVGPDRNEAETVARLLDDAKQQGKVRAVGISTNHLPDIEYLHSIGCLDVVQFASNMLSPADDVRSLISKYTAGGVVRGAFAAGKLSGKYIDSPPRFAPDDIRAGWFDANTIAEEFARVAPLKKLVTPDRSILQLALRYLLDQPTTHTIILGAKRFEEYADAAHATELPPLNDVEREHMASVRA